MTQETDRFGGSLWRGASQLWKFAASEELGDAEAEARVRGQARRLEVDGGVLLVGVRVDMTVSRES